MESVPFLVWCMCGESLIVSNSLSTVKGREDKVVQTLWSSLPIDTFFSVTLTPTLPHHTL